MVICDFSRRLFISLLVKGIDNISNDNIERHLGLVPIQADLRVSARENRAEAGRRGSADLHHISVGCCSYQSSNHGNIYFLIDIIVFENRPPPQKKIAQEGC